MYPWQEHSSNEESASKDWRHWVVAKYFDHEPEKQRVAIHDYQQTEIREMRCMDNSTILSLWTV
jgi:hypothetical protein